jgi:hypothetical protein
MVEIFRMVENPLAGVTRNDLVILADFLEDLRPDSNLTDFTYFVTRRSDPNAASKFSNALVPRSKVLWQ